MAQSKQNSRTVDSEGVSGAQGCRSESEGSHGHTEALELTLPVPPSTNNAYSNNIKTGGRRLTPKGRAYKRDVHHLANDAGVQRMKFEAPYSLSLIVYFDSTRRSDISNRVKLVEDALMEAIGGDDTDVRTMWLEKRISRENPRAEVTLYGANHDIVRQA